MLVSGVVHQKIKAPYDHLKSLTVFYWRPSFWKSVASFWSPLSLGRGWRLDEKWCHPKLILQRDSPTFQDFSRLVKCDSPRFVFVSDINSNVYDCMLFEYMMYMYIYIVYTVYFIQIFHIGEICVLLRFWSAMISAWSARLTYQTGWRRLASSTSVRHLSRKKTHRNRQTAKTTIDPQQHPSQENLKQNTWRCRWVEISKEWRNTLFFRGGGGFKPCFSEPGWGKGERLVVHATRLGDWLMKPLEQREKWQQNQQEKDGFLSEVHVFFFWVPGLQNSGFCMGNPVVDGV